MTVAPVFATLPLLAAEPAPAGGSALSEIAAATVVAFLAVGAVVALGVAHRRRGLLTPLAREIEHRTGLPACAALPGAITAVSLLVAVVGYHWDVSWHIDRGRDPGAFANPAHWLILGDPLRRLDRAAALPPAEGRRYDGEGQERRGGPAEV